MGWAYRHAPRRGIMRGHGQWPGATACWVPLRPLPPGSTQLLTQQAASTIRVPSSGSSAFGYQVVPWEVRTRLAHAERKDDAISQFGVFAGA